MNVDESVNNVKDHMSRHVSNEIKSQMTKMKDEVLNAIERKVFNVIEAEVSHVIQEEVIKQTKPLEEKLDHISHLLDRLLDV